MHTSLRVLLIMLVAAWTGAPLLAATTSTHGKKSSKSETTVKKKKASAKSETAAVKQTAPPPPELVNEEPPAPVMTPAVVSTLSIEDLSGFEHYPKQIQSLVQSCLALTHLELGYLYGSSEPSQGGMDCSGTIYHVLHFQGLKDVPRQSDEMCQWVDKKTHLYPTPTATSFGSEEFDALKPGDLLFWTNTTATTRKLPVTHVMVYLGKLKKNGKRIVFGSSDGRSFNGERRSGVSVFDFSLPRPESTSRFYGYGPTPGLLPVEPERPVLAVVTPTTSPVTSPAAKESVKPVAAPPPAEPKAVEKPVVKAAVAANEAPKVKETPEPKVVAAVSKETPAAKTSSMHQETPKPKVVTAVKKEAPAPKVVASTSVTQEAPRTKIVASVNKETPATQESTPTPATQEAVVVSKDKTPSKTSVAHTEPSLSSKKVPAAPESAAPKEEIRRAIAVTSDVPADSASKKSAVTDAKSESSAKSNTTTKSNSSSSKKHSTTVASNTRRRRPSEPQKSVIEQKMERAVSSVKRFFQQ